VVGTLKANTTTKPKRKKWVQIFALILFCAGFYGFPSSTLSLTFVTWGSAFLLFIWDHHTDKQADQVFKRKYIAKFDQTRLYSSLHNPNLVYERIDKSGDTLTLKTIWSGTEPVIEGEIRKTNLNDIRPFDLDIFINLT
jgi:hypothetical protein